MVVVAVRVIMHSCYLTGYLSLHNGENSLHKGYEIIFIYDYASSQGMDTPFAILLF